ncbi:MAG: PKD domain-containing protein [Bacteroidota bacterium]
MQILLRLLTLTTIAALLSSCQNVVEACFTINDSDCSHEDACTILFDASCSKNEGEYYWDFGDGTEGTGMEVAHTYTRAGEYEVSLRVDNAINTGVEFEEDILTQTVNVLQGSAQSQETFSHTYINEKSFSQFNSVVQTSDSGYVMVGYFEDNIALHGYMRKVDAAGNTLWDKTFTRGNDDIRLHDIQLTLDGGMIIAGQVNRFRDESEGYLVKTDRNGVIIWEYYTGTRRRTEVSFTKVIEMSTGHYLAVGNYNYQYSNSAIWLMSIGFDGDFRWEQSLDKGDYRLEGYYSVSKTEDGGFMVLSMGDPPGSNNEKLVLTKVNGEGQKEWDLILGEEGKRYLSGDITPTEDGNFLLVGTFRAGSSRNRDIYLAKITPTGGILWEKEMGTPLWDQIFSISQTNNGGFVMAGSTQIEDGSSYPPYYAYLVRLNSEGKEIWSRTYEQFIDSEVSRVSQTKEGGYIMAGRIIIDERHSQRFVMKTNSEGELF